MPERLDKIRVGAVVYVTEEELIRASSEDIKERVLHDLGEELSHYIMNKCNVIETKNMENGGVQLRAECYVLTPDSFSRLVENIQKCLLQFNPTMIGGVDSN